MKTVVFGVFLLLFNFTTLAQTRFLTLSKGGGFAGTSTVYKVFSDGKILKGNGFSPIRYTEEAKLKKSKAKKCIKHTKALMTSFADFNHPGNMYYSIVLVENDVEQKIVWGDNKQPAPDKVLEIYNELVSVLSHLPFTKIIQQQ